MKHNYPVLEKEKYDVCPSPPGLRSLFPAKSSGTLKNKKHLEHLFCDGKSDSNAPVLYVCQLRLTGGYIILSSPSSVLTNRQFGGFPFIGSQAKDLLMLESSFSALWIPLMER